MFLYIDYTNYKGERDVRLISAPFKVWWGSTQYHREPQWLLDATDLHKGRRTFAVRDIHGVEKV